MHGTGIAGASTFILLNGEFGEFIHNALLLFAIGLGLLVLTSFILTRLIRLFIR